MTPAGRVSAEARGAETEEARVEAEMAAGAMEGAMAEEATGAEVTEAARAAEVMAEVAREGEMVVEVREVVVREVARVEGMVGVAMAGETAECPTPRQHSSATQESRKPHGSRKCGGCSPTLPRAADRVAHEHTPPTSIQAGHPGHSQ